MLAACSGDGGEDTFGPDRTSSTTNPPNTTTTEPTATSDILDDRDTAEALFVVSLDVSGDPVLEGLDDATVQSMIGLADEFCATFDRGGSYEDIQALILDVEPEYADQMGYVIGAGTESFCPEHSDLLPS